VPRLTKIYTRKGDDGTTKLADGSQIRKDSPRVEAYGSVDELNAQIGVVLSQGVHPDLAPGLKKIQNQLFHLGAMLSTPSDAKATPPGPQIREGDVTQLEAHINRLNDALGPLENFILPGGAPSAAGLQLARAICRRAERRIVSLIQEESVPDVALKYVNRLSDALFVFARFENMQRGIEEPLWDSKA
jgi:cob(I)alamin adenosyltransferase